ncbi:hypothetical protein COT44_01265 [Candidatus Shapirobacteria bacterium CG08_land_8_20_14_0_20_39_18]|uniref:Peptidase C39-like domain-containing protein n=2 Tax=Microgenomates group TaxID=1794810 RepID=A0A2M6XDR7_9BACT|nr:MAG: hypothetical protein COT44_01265 [Candidatus Shapirobacteria bacterium CG08_land_8_20_14_0_20_39_18]PIY66273.1 MAG: hypothetical protein COY91_00870 [Candidatus Shapirobacteria bacterium CG_4_10_14_0_8_um_filter_39_15]
MKKILLFLVLLVLFLIPCRVYSQSVGELQQQIDDLTQKVTDLQNQGKTLASQITYMDSQIKLTTLKITQTQSQIDDLTLKIGRLEVSLDQMSVILKSRIAAAYEQGQPNVLSLFFSSSKFADFYNRYKYLRVIQINDKKILYSMETTRTNYDDQKQAVVALETKLQLQKTQLAQQQTDKKNLLIVTKNDEKKFQELLKKALAELASLKRFSQDNPGGILPPQQSPDGWFYSQRDERWAKQMIGGSTETIYDVGCLISDIAMISTFYGDRRTPSDIAADSSNFFSNTAYMVSPWPSQAGKTYTELLNMDAVDQELSAGHPVIVHLNLGGDGHFIVLKQKDGDDYLIHDPWFGYDKKLKDFYSVAVIDKRVVYK